MRQVFLAAQLTVKRFQSVSLVGRKRPPVGAFGEIDQGLDVFRFRRRARLFDPADPRRDLIEKLFDGPQPIDIGRGPQFLHVQLAEPFHFFRRRDVLVFGAGEIELRIL